MSHDDMFIPTTLDELSPAFLQGVLRQSGALARSGRVTACRPEPMGEGLGFACQVTRLHLSYDAPKSGPASVIAKLPTPVARNRSSVEAAQGYEREVCFYRELAVRSRLPLPRCYYAGMDPDRLYEWRPRLLPWLERLPVWVFRVLIRLARSRVTVGRRRYLLLLEDLAPAESPDQVAGCDRPRAEQALRGLAAFHAGYWADEGLAEKIWLPPANRMVRAFVALHRATRRGFCDRHGDRVPARMQEAWRFMDRRSGAVMRHLASAPFTVVHGDFRLDNLFFDGERMWAVDFQNATRARPGMDLAYFVAGSVDPAVDEAALLDAYCDELARQGVSGYSRGECERDFALAKLLLAYLHTATDDDLFDVGSGRGARLFEAMRTRLFARLPEPPFEPLLEGAARADRGAGALG